MPTQTLSSAAEAHRRQVILAAGAIAAVRRSRTQDAATLTRIIAAYQLIAAREGAAAVSPMLAEQGLSTTTEAGVALTLLAGYASSGYPLPDLLPKVTPGTMARFVQTMIADAGRQGSALARYTRPSVTGYVRMLNPPSCPDCTVLAGKFYPDAGGVRFVEVRPNVFATDRTGDSGPFQRHPRCDCLMIPSSEQVAGDLTTDPKAYFDSLSPAEQDAWVGSANAQAIRDGADMSQVINARKKVQQAQVFGQQIQFTTAGTSRRAVFGAANARRATPLPYRLMPETIYEHAKDRADALRLLKLYGYLL